MRSPKLTSFTAGALCMLVLGSGSAVAATGGKFILGRSNSATATTSLTNTRGTALTLRVPSGRAPLAVNSRTRVNYLNADTVDGLSSEYVARTTGRTGTREVFSAALSFDPASNGETDTLIALAQCPSGTILTGGGFDDTTQTGVVVQNSPDTDATVWQVIALVDPAAAEQPEDLRAWATCYNPKGAVARQTTAIYTQLPAARTAATPQLRQSLAAQRSAR